MQMNELTMQREDTSHQRARADLEAAGLHPTLAAGGANATTLSAARGSGGGAGGSAAGHNPLQGPDAGTIIQAALAEDQIKTGQAQRALTNAEAARVRQESRYIGNKADEVINEGLRRDSANAREEQYAGFASAAEARAADQFAWETTLRVFQRNSAELDNLAKAANVNKTRLEHQILEFQRNHIARHGTTMPTADSFVRYLGLAEKHGRQIWDWYIPNVYDKWSDRGARLYRHMHGR